MNRLGFIGAGNMGSALIRGLIDFDGMAADHVYACGHHPEILNAFARKKGFHVCETVDELLNECDAVLLAVKPKHIEALLSEYREGLIGKTVLSVVSGYDFARTQTLLAPGARFLYIMPNTPCEVGAGTFLFEKAHSLPDAEYADVRRRFERMGRVLEVPSNLMAVGAAVAGCGPAFVAMMLEALADAAVKHGVPRALAYELASQMTVGAATLQLKTGVHPGQLKDAVCSPGGTTIRGVQALEKAGMRAAFMDAVDAVMNVGR